MCSMSRVTYHMSGVRCTHSIIHGTFSSNIFHTLPIPNRKSQGADILREFSSHSMCHVSCVMCHMSHVPCHLSPVMCHVSCVTFHMSNYFFYLKKKMFFCLKKMDKVVELVSGGSIINGAYPVQFLWWSQSVEGLLSAGPTPCSF